MATTVDSGSQLTVISTEHTLETTTTAGVFVAMLNLTTLAAGDVLRLRIKTKVLTGDTEEAIWDVVYANDQGAIPIVHTPPLVSMFSLTFTIQQTAGSVRTLPWALIQVDA